MDDITYINKNNIIHINKNGNILHCDAKSLLIRKKLTRHSQHFLFKSIDYDNNNLPIQITQVLKHAVGKIKKEKTKLRWEDIELIGYEDSKGDWWDKHVMSEPLPAILWSKVKWNLHNIHRHHANKMLDEGYRTTDKGFQKLLDTHKDYSDSVWELLSKMIEERDG